ncbi:MAG: ribonuclease P protein component [Candidatus Promineifilaceae bacterium]|nr:ribonuclease P protein component [Candidatus Promineifilaceae bacterium]
MLPERYRLRRNADIRRVHREGRRWRHPLLILFVSANNQDASRFAISVSRRVGKAVVRNRCRRRVREIIRRRLADVEPGWDCLLVARTGLPAASFDEIEAAVDQLFRRSGILACGD